MTKFIKIIKFVKKYRALGVARFKVITNSDTFVLTVNDEGYEDQIRIKYK